MEPVHSDPSQAAVSDSADRDSSASPSAPLRSAETSAGPNVGISYRAPPSRLRTISALVLLLAGLTSCVLAQWLEQAPWWMNILGLLCTLIAAWLHGRGLADGTRLFAALVGFGLGALAAALAWWWLMFAAVGLGAGYLCAWGYGKGHRGWWFSLALVVAVHLGAGVAGLVRILNGGPVWWSLSHGLLTLLLGAALILWSGGGTSARRSHALKMGRIAVMLALLLPYLALTLLGIRPA